ncbi:hypothetical protein [Geodermatophilus sp. CPCC 205761]|uniref:hypothetical protein n=1 Tax=Geodermatophilus sp. CPCC 205761 TaxID=2936597 RepID=UPI003EEC128D
MTGELLWAVTDGPAGENAVPAPEDRLDAGRLARHHRGGFWCSTRAGGCGGRLVLQAPGGGRPSFGHPGGARCALTEADAGRAYEHLRYQPALTAWLAGQGHDARLERGPDPGGHSGLHVVVDELGVVLEVQLAPLPDTAWRERDDHLRRRHRHVTWLYGPEAEAAAVTEVAVRGVAVALRRHHVGLSVGVRDVDDRTRWVRLAACRLTADGFAAPGTEEARALHAARTAHRQRAARRVRHRAAGPPVPQLGLPFPA